MAAIDKNWAPWDFDETTHCKINISNPTVGFGGGTVYQQLSLIHI